MRYFFEIAYHGKNYNGWQSQHTGLGIQEVVENALSKLLREEIQIQGSGRTDTGVHCEQQFFHADVTEKINVSDLIIKLNSILPKDIAIRDIFEVNPNANARYDAVERTYRYEISRVKNPFLTDLAWHFFKKVNVQTMNHAAALLVGEFDYECFSKVKTNVNHFLCDIKKAEWQEDGDRLVFFITANRFLRGMVRAIVGTLLDVGSGKISEQDFQHIIKSKDRKRASANVPAHGLYLMKVVYSESVYIK